MVAANLQFKLIDVIWAEANDARWHTLEDIAKRVHSSNEKVALALDFLQKYGFVRSFTTDERRFRISLGTPSPMETAHGLRSLLCAYEAESTPRYVF